MPYNIIKVIYILKGQKTGKHIFDKGNGVEGHPKDTLDSRDRTGEGLLGPGHVSGRSADGGCFLRCLLFHHLC